VSWGQANALNNAPQTSNNCKPAPRPCPPKQVPCPKPVPKPTPTPVPVKPAPAPEPEPTPEPVPVKPALTPGQVDVHYPETENAEINTAIKSRIDGIVADFEGRAIEAGNGDPKGANIKITYDSSFIGDDFLSLRFTTAERLTEGETPQVGTFTLLYNLKTGAAVDINDVFANSNFAEELSVLVRDGLKGSEGYKGNDAELELLNKGTEANAHNFQNIFINNGKLYILFAPGQISSSGDVKEFVIDMKDHSELFSKAFQVS